MENDNDLNKKFNSLNEQLEFNKVEIETNVINKLSLEIEQHETKVTQMNDLINGKIIKGILAIEKKIE